VVERTSDRATKATKSKGQRGHTAANESRPTDVDVVDADADDAAVPKKKKMRKLNVNVFASAKPDSLDWANQFNLVSRTSLSGSCDTVTTPMTFVQGGNLDIPTELSPVKVPPRSLASRSASSFRKS
jgi:hypothetical protein